MKIAILTSEFYPHLAPHDDRTAFTLHWARLLQKHTKDEIAIFHALPEKWWTPRHTPTEPYWLEGGIKVIPDLIDAHADRRWPNARPMAISDTLREKLPEFDIVYALDLNNLAYELLRQRRFHYAHYPTVVTVLLGGSVLRAMTESTYFSLITQHAEAFIERYSAEQSDFIVATSQFIVDYARNVTDWSLPAETHVLGTPFVSTQVAPTVEAAPRFKHLLYFGQTTAEFGLDHLIHGLGTLHRLYPAVTSQIESVILLGNENQYQPRARHTLIRLSYAYAFDLQTRFSFDEQMEFLRAHAGDSLVIVPPSPSNTPYTLLDAASITGLNLIYPASGGMPEMFEGDARQSYAADSVMMAQKIAAAWTTPPRTAADLPYIDFDTINTRWLDFHAQVSRHHEHTMALALPVLTQITANPAVDICVPYFNQPKYLPQMLQSLELQTVTNFQVIIIDDGSTDPEARRVFDDMRAKYSPRGWIFERQANAYPGAARNHAARLGNAEYIIFLDSDDVAPDYFVARLLEAIRTSGDDSVIASTYRFLGEDYPIGDDGKINVPPNMLYMPVGNDLVGSQMNDLYGGPTMIIRRNVFNALGGYTEIKGIGYEDYELHVRTGLAGYKVDALPDTLHWYRQLDGGVSTTTNQYRNHTRVTRYYDDRYDPLGLYHLATATHSVMKDAEIASETIDLAKPVLGKRWHARLGLGARTANRSNGASGGRRLNILMMAPYFPYPANSGGSIRVWEAIRYFGARHDITFVSFINYRTTRFDMSAITPYLKSAYTVPHNSRPVAEMDMLTDLIKQRVSGDLVEILKMIPSRNFDVAMFAHIYTTPYLAYVDAPFMVLDEQNIESELSEQVAQAGGQKPELTVNFTNELETATGLRQYEQRIWRHFDLISAVSAHDKSIIDERSGRDPADTLVVDNGTSFTKMTPRARPDTNTILFLGTLNYYPNIDGMFYFVDEILPLIRQRNPSIKFFVVGRDPRQDIIELCKQPGITLFNTPKEIPPIMWRTSASIVPLRFGGGTRLKILDSMALGVPVVSTSLGFLGLHGEDGEHLLVRDDPQAFADSVNEVLTNRGLWQQLSENGRQLAVERYSWDSMWKPLEERMWGDFVKMSKRSDAR